MNKILFSLFLLCANTVFTPIFAQNGSPYRLSWAGDASALGVGLAFPIVNHYLWQPNVAALTEAQIMALSRNDVSLFDRSATYNANYASRKASDIGLISSIVLPSVLFLDSDIRRDYAQVSTLYAETLLLNYLLTESTKQLVQRPRPLTYNPNVPLSEKMEQDARLSFYSGHTSTTAASTFFAAKVYSDYHPNSPALPYVWGTAALLPAAVGYLRYDGGKHFPTDIIVGYLLGAAVGFLVPELHKIKKN
jgi:membrane-associated phospholipid phosphatase